MRDSFQDWAGAGPLGEVRGGPDPGSRRAAGIALVLATIFFCITAAMQNISALTAPPPEPEAVETITPEPSFFTLSSKIIVAADHELGKPPPGSLADLEPETLPDLVRSAIVKGQIDGAEEAIAELRAVQKAWLLNPEVPDQLRDDVGAFLNLYQQGSDSLTEPERQGLEERHGWFARVAFVHDLPEADADRNAVLSEGMNAIYLLVGVLVLAAAGLVTGIVLLVLGAVKWPRMRASRRFIPPAPGGSVYLETFALFVGAFLVMQVATGLLGTLKLNPNVTLGIALGAQWLLLLVAAWPLVRGASVQQWRAHLGLYRGAGFFREVGCGIVGYIAGLPLLAGAFVLTFIFAQVWHSVTGKAPTPHNPAAEAAASGDVLVTVLIVTLATIWAPLAEETMFRGALYRHVRSKAGVAGAVLLTAMMFAIMHSYGPVFLSPLVALGAVFALLREWRGSIIASMTAHALHNSMLIALVLGLSRVMQ